MNKENPAFKVYRRGPLFSVYGPDGLPWFDRVSDSEAQRLCDLLERAFSAGSYHEAKKHLPPVPGPPNPPKKIHPSEVG